MTREDAIETIKEFPTYLQDQIDHNGYGDVRFDIEQAKSDIIAFNMAIEALEDIYALAEALDSITNWECCTYGYDNEVNKAMKWIESSKEV